MTGPRSWRLERGPAPPARADHGATAAPAFQGLQAPGGGLDLDLRGFLGWLSPGLGAALRRSGSAALEEHPPPTPREGTAGSHAGLS